MPWKPGAGRAGRGKCARLQEVLRPAPDGTIDSIQDGIIVEVVPANFFGNQCRSNLIEALYCAWVLHNIVRISGLRELVAEKMNGTRLLAMNLGERRVLL